MNEVSVVIPTRNRKESLFRLLGYLSKQEYPLAEVIVVDSSDQIIPDNELGKQFPALNIIYLTSSPSVCIQRNIGIRKAESPFIFLCDDDIEFQPDYVSLLMNHIVQTNSSAVSGLILQKENGEWTYQYPVSSFSHLLFTFIFQLSVWGNFSHLKTNFLQRPIFNLIGKFYRWKQNDISFAGWPLLTDFSKPFFRTTIYGLGASIVRKTWLENSLYDEKLDAHGIGDNYGVAVNFPQSGSISVVFDAKALHHQSTDNRLSTDSSQYRRILALHYFMTKNRRFNLINRLFFLWSLVGNLILNRKNEKTFSAIKEALILILTGKNPYLKN